MPWFKIDDGFWSHPKILELSDAAVALWVRAGSYCAGHLTDGVVKQSTLRMLGADRDAATELVLAGLWDVNSDGVWSFHDWQDYQPKSEKVKADREAARERMRAVRANKARTFEDGSATPSRPVPSRTTTQLLESQSLDTRANVSTDPIPISTTTKRLAAQKGINNLRTVVDAIHRKTGVTVTADQAFQLCVLLLERAKEWPDNPQPYVLSCISKNPHEITQHLYERIGVS